MAPDRPGPAPARAAAALLALALAGCGGKSVTAPPLPPLSRVAIVPRADTLAVGTRFQFTATAYDTNDVAVPGAGFQWRSTNLSVFAVSGTGLVTARGEGTARLVATAGGRSDTASVTVFVRTGWYVQPSGTINTLNGVYALADGFTAWAVGDAGTIVATTNAGASWAAQVSNTAFNLNGVWFTSATEGWAVGNGGTVMHTPDAGVTWTRATNVGASEDLNDVYFADAQHGWAVGTSGAIVRTRDGGAHWSEQHPTANALESVAFSDTANGWAVGQSGVIVGTHDGGASWYVVQPSVTALALKAVWRRSNTLAWAGGATGAFAFSTATTDSLQWNLGSFGASNQIEGLQFLDDRTGFAVGSNGNGVVFRTGDGGGTWTAQVSNSAQALRDVWFTDAQHGWAVGTGGRIIHTATGGQ